MSKTSLPLLVIATGPLLEEGSEFVSGQCLRTLHFVRPLWEEGHDVRLITIPIPGTETSEHRFSLRTLEMEGRRYQAVGTSSMEAIIPPLRKLLRSGKFRAVVGINPYPAALVAFCGPLEIPFWADLNGYTMAEGQTRSARMNSDQDFPHFWRMEAQTLLTADRFSTVTNRQADALYGELAMLGRFSRFTHEEPFAHAVPNAVYKLYADLKRSTTLPKELFREFGLDDVASSEKLVLWSGGFNTWTNTALLVDAAERILGAVPNARIVCTGGPVKVHDDGTYIQFLERLEKMPHKDRVHLLNWTSLDRVLALHARADCGINVDGANSETRFGARNRLTNMLGCGLPVVTTSGTEIADWIHHHQVGLVTPLNDAAAFAEAVIRTLQDESATDKRAKKGRKLALSEFAPAATLPEFLQWCEAPIHAADHHQPPTAIRQKVETLLSGEYDDAFIARASLHHLRQKWPLRAWYSLKRLLKK